MLGSASQWLNQFQSLKGILVDFNGTFAEHSPRDGLKVSIPERDFSWFQPSES